MIIDEKAYYVHVPRTGGRYLKKLFKANFNTVYDFSTNNIQKDKFGVIKDHWHYPMYLLREDQMNENAKYFTVIRDPFEKIISQLGIELRRSLALLEKLKDKKNFINYIEEQRRTNSYHNNWYRPQIDFVGKETLVWHYSLGFKEDFFKWLNENLKLKITATEVESYEKIASIDEKIAGRDKYDLSYIKEYTYMYYDKDLEFSKKTLERLKNDKTRRTKR